MKYCCKEFENTVCYEGFSIRPRWNEGVPEKILYYEMVWEYLPFEANEMSWSPEVWKGKRINYCPWCGKKLKQED